MIISALAKDVITVTVCDRVGVNAAVRARDVRRARLCAEMRQPSPAPQTQIPQNQPIPYWDPPGIKGHRHPLSSNTNDKKC